MHLREFFKFLTIKTSIHTRIKTFKSLLHFWQEDLCLKLNIEGIRVWKPFMKLFGNDSFNGSTTPSPRDVNGTDPSRLPSSIELRFGWFVLSFASSSKAYHVSLMESHRHVAPKQYILGHRNIRHKFRLKRPHKTHSNTSTHKNTF